MELPQRKPNRLSDFDYNQNGAYFVTICTQDRRKILSSIVGGGAHDAPNVVLTTKGTSRAPSPTNAVIPRLISTFKWFYHLWDSKWEKVCMVLRVHSICDMIKTVRQI